MKAWLEPKTVISLIGAVTTLILALAEHRRANQAEGRVDKLETFIADQSDILFE